MSSIVFATGFTFTAFLTADFSARLKMSFDGDFSRQQKVFSLSLTTDLVKFICFWEMFNLIICWGS